MSPHERRALTTVAQRRAGFDSIFAEEHTRLRHAELTEAGRALIDVLFPLAMAVVSDHDSAPH